MEDKLAHLQMLQAVISRMASNSFFLKGWSVTLVSALFALAADKANPHFAYVAYLPVLMFWGLDGYYLRQERLFRALYDRVRLTNEHSKEFSMDTAPVAKSVDTLTEVCFSPTVAVFHGALLATVFIIMLIVMSQ